MAVNQRDPYDSPARTAAILRILGIEESEIDASRRVQRFAECNGFAGVMAAAEFTASRTTEIKDPWRYAVHVFNHNLGRLSLLYVLTHWAERSLRSRIDMGLTRAIGPSWHEVPDGYLPERSIGYFVGDKSQPIRWTPDPRLRGRMRAETTSSVEFLEAVTLGWLVQVMLHNYRPRLSGCLVRPDGSSASFDEAQSLLDVCNETRREVAHNRYIPNHAYSRQLNHLMRLLELLQFDVTRALARSEQARRQVVDQVLRERSNER